MKTTIVSSTLAFFLVEATGRGNILNPPIPLIGEWSHRLEAWMQYKKLLDVQK